MLKKKIEGDKITQKVLNYYYPSGQLMRKITSDENNTGFYATEYYQNGKVETEATYINENNKIGIEKKYDTNGTLRQEVPWVLPENEEAQNTIRQGEIVTYYPNGKKAASFSVGKNGKTIFYNQQGEIIKEITDSQILKFPQELTDEDCQGKTIHLDLQALIELYEDEGDISYNRCGMPYRENFVYEVLETTPQTENIISFDETGMIRRITPYQNGVKHGVEQKFDASGNLTAEINYQNGKKHGDAHGYFPTKEVAFQKHYENGKVEGKLSCFYPTGEVAAEFNYQQGVKEGTAIINSPIKKQLQFSQGKLLDEQNNSEEREVTSVLSLLEKPAQDCLPFEDKLAEIQKNINEKAMQIEQTFTIHIPDGCDAINTFITENNMLVCKDSQNQKRADVSVDYNQGKNVIEKIYTSSGLLQYDIPLVNQKRQGWAKTYAEDGRMIADVYFNQGERTGNSRSYYPNGQVKDMLVSTDDNLRKVWIAYNQEGNVIFNLTSKENEKKEAYFYNPATEKEISVRFYSNKPDIIRENTPQNPYDFTEYNLAIGEYAVYNNNELISGGHLCNIKPAENIKITSLPAKNAVKAEQNPTTIAQQIEPEPGITEAPILSPEDAPLIDEKEIKQVIEDDKTDLSNVEEIIPSEKEKQQAELAAKNIGPVAKPDIENMAAVVQREVHDTDLKRVEENQEPKTEKLYYPNGNIRKTIKTKGSRTEEIKEYSKNGLLLTDTQYNKDKIIIEKYFGSGEIRRKTEKNYDDNAVNAFVKREDFYDNGNPRYIIERQTQTMLFSEKTYDAEGKVKTETAQTGPLTFSIKEYDKEKDTVKGYLYPEDKNIITGKDSQAIRTYYAGGKTQTEVTWYNNGEIVVKEYNKDGSLTKFAYLAASDGKLHIEKPELRIIPAYRERYWVDYNNPHWIENQDKYSVKSIARLNLDIASRILAELKIAEPQVIKLLKGIY